MGSPISGTLVEIYFQYLEQIHVKHYLESRDIIYYKRYVDDILIILDQRKANEKAIYNIINNTDAYLEFKLHRQEGRTPNYLDLSINTDLSIYMKPLYIDVTMHLSSNHPYDHKLEVFHYYINRMINIPIVEQAAK